MFQSMPALTHIDPSISLRMAFVRRCTRVSIGTEFVQYKHKSGASSRECLDRFDFLDPEYVGYFFFALS